jgi:hypothetical protein
VALSCHHLPLLLLVLLLLLREIFYGIIKQFVYTLDYAFAVTFVGWVIHIFEI